jgi:hypothetical protein
MLDPHSVLVQTELQKESGNCLMGKDWQVSWVMMQVRREEMNLHCCQGWRKQYSSQ